MLDLWSGHSSASCDKRSRRRLLQAGALAVGGLTLGELLQVRANAAGRVPTIQKSVIMVYLNGGPSHLDMYDLKPKAPVEYRGEFRPISTNVPGMELCELFPLQATIADKFAIVRNMKFQQEGHTAPELYSGFLKGNRPSFGSVVSKLREESGQRSGLPSYVYVGDANHVGHPGFLAKAHEAYIPGPQAANLGLAREITLERLSDRRKLLQSFDELRRDVSDLHGSVDGLVAFNSLALDMITSNRARDAFDITREPAHVRTRYGKGTEYLQALRLVEAGVPVVTITPQNHELPSTCNGQWDHHDHIFKCLRIVLPQLDRSLHALLTDLAERGLAHDVLVVVWGEMGRTPRVGTQRGTVGGRDHWPQSGFAVLAGGGLQMGQVIGATDSRGERSLGRSYTPQNVLATIYHHLGIDPATTLLDSAGRPIALLDDQARITELG